MSLCELCKMRDYTTPATTFIHGFTEEGQWTWELPVCSAHEGVQGVQPCVRCEEQFDRIVPGQKRNGWEDVMCGACYDEAEKALERERVLGR